MAAIDACPTQGSEVKRFVTPEDSGYTWTDAGGALAQIFQGFSLRRTKQRAQLSGSTGSRQRHPNTDIEVAGDVSGIISKAHSAIDAAFWLPKIENVSEFAILELLGSVNRYEYRDLKVASATISGVEGQAVDLSTAVVGKGWRDKDADQDGNTSNTAAADPDSNIAAIPSTGSSIEAYKPLLMAEMQLAVGSDTFSFGAASVTIDNGLAVRRYNSKHPKCIKPGMRTVGLSLSLPYNSGVIGVWKDVGDAGLASASLSILRYLSPGSATPAIGYTLDFGLLKFPDDGPSVVGDDDIGYTINAIAYEDTTGGNPDITFGTVDTNTAA